MLWSLIKILAFVAAITALTFGATQLMEVDGGATISVGGMEFTLSTLEMVFALVALVVLVWLGLKLLKFLVAAFKFLNGDETAISRYFDRNREKKGYEALSEGMMALASGEGHLAMTKAARADRLLDQPQLTTLLKAQAAEMTGDKRQARRDAVLALSEARDILDQGKDIEAREAAIEANRLSPDLIPAAVMAARSYMSDDKARYAARVLTKAWGAQPHPDLASAFAEIVPDEDAKARLKRFRALTKQHPNDPETKMLLAELNIAAEDFPQAKRALGDLTETDPTARSLTLMAAIERGQGADDAVVRGWLTSAVSSPRGPQWICDNCQHIHSNWEPVCANCASIDSLAWKRPPVGEVAMPTGTEMLPLIVGAPDDNDDIVDAVVPAEDIVVVKADPVDDGEAKS